MSLIKENDQRPNAKNFYNYFEGHECYLPKYKISNYEIPYNKFRYIVLYLIAINMGDTRARKLFKSSASLCAEKYRQYEYFPWSIHPYSRFCLWFKIFFMFILIITTLLMALLYSSSDPKSNSYLRFILLCTDIIYVFNIFISLFTGYVEGYSCKSVELNLKKIMVRYSGTWLLLDIISISSIVPDIFKYESLKLELILDAMRVLRVPKHYFYIEDFLEVVNAELITEIISEAIFLLTTYLLWNIYFQYAMEYILEGTYKPSSPRNCSWVTIGKLWNRSSTVRFLYALDRAVGMLRGNANLNLLEEDGCFDIYFMFSWFISKGLILHCTYKYIIAILGSESARSNYFVMTEQVKMYLNQRKFPPRIKKKILKFYAIRFHSHFFVEARMMSCLTGQLKEDIIMHTGRQLVQDVEFLKQLPRPLLLQIGTKLRVVIFIAGDIIIKINTIGDCLFFIYKGTVAVYSESGKEVCHLEDGDFFGEIALIMKNRLRSASVVAVTNCELFQLNREDFESSVASYSSVYEDFKKIATTRLEKTTVLDEHNKSDIKMKARKRADSVSYQF